MNRLLVIAAALAVAVCGPLAHDTNAEPTLLPMAEHTLDLPRGFSSLNATGMSVTYNPNLHLGPGLDRYYGADGGNVEYSVHVWDNAGTLLETVEHYGLDFRTIYYNENNGDMEAVTFEAMVPSGADAYLEGLSRLQMNASGFFDSDLSDPMNSPNGVFTRVLTGMPELSSDNVVPAYDAKHNVFYSRAGTGNQVDVVSREDNSLVDSFVLDGWPGTQYVQQNFIGFDPACDWLISFWSKYGEEKAYVHDLDGRLVGTVDFPDSYRYVGDNTEYQATYTNGQIFIMNPIGPYDVPEDERYGVWEGFRIMEGGLNLIPEPSTFVLVVLSGLCLYGLRRYRKRNA